MLLRLVSLLVAGAGPLVFAHAAVAAGGDWSKDFNISGTADLRVEIDDGRVTLTGTDAKRIEVRVTATGWQIGSNGVQVIDRQAGDRVELDVRVPHSMGIFNMGNRSIRVEIRVPNGALANVHTHDGSITLEALRGSLKMKTGDGRIEATRVDGTMDASTGDGSIRVRGRLDGLALHSGDGSIEAELSAGSKMASLGYQHRRRPCDPAPAPELRGRSGRPHRRRSDRSEFPHHDVGDGRRTRLAR